MTKLARRTIISIVRLLRTLCATFVLLSIARFDGIMAKSNFDQNSPVGQIVEYLQRSGSATIKELESVLGVTTNAVRLHLNSLLGEGYIERRRVSEGVGRPHYAYFATAKVNELFACHCDDLALTLLQEVFALEGAEKTGHLLGRVSERLATRYEQTVRSTVLQERVEELATALNGRGVLADASVVEENGDDVVLKTYNCPFHELATEHREVCAMDQSMMEKVLGAEVSLESNMMDGHGCCSFVVTSRSEKE